MYIAGICSGLWFCGVMYIAGICSGLWFCGVMYIASMCSGLWKDKRGDRSDRKTRKQT
jgi:hypothetical protein